ncbi:MAG: SH3 domain-containing protein [Deltaproteobacteria bacterium]|jgi:hypothetical protein
MGYEVARCFRGAAEPEDAVIAGAGTTVRVRARSLTFDVEDGGHVVCEAHEGLAGQLVLMVDPVGGERVAVLQGARMLDDGPERDIVRLPGTAEVTVVRMVHYCPDGTTDCVMAGSREALSAFVDIDPHGPRSGWDLTTQTLSASPVRRAGTEWLADRSCGLEVGFRGAPPSLRCTGTIEERLRCIAEAAMTREEDIDQERVEREAAAFRLVLTDGHQELTAPGFEVASLACVDGHLLYRQAGPMFSSVRGYGAIRVRGGRIAGGHRMSIRDHEEGVSECGNAWDGVVLVPVLRGGAVVGGLVLGAGGRPFFDLVRGDIGDVQTPAFWPGLEGDPPTELEESGFGYGDSVIPVALRETIDGFLAIAPAAPGQVCTLVVDDADGNTNVRPEASTRREPVGTLPNGTTIVPVEQRGRWYRIETPAQGWVFATSLRRDCAPSVL